MTGLAELWTEHAIALSTQLGVLVVAAGILAFVFRHASPRVRYALWGVVLARSLVPVVLASPIGLLPAPRVPPEPASLTCPEPEAEGSAVPGPVGRRAAPEAEDGGTPAGALGVPVRPLLAGGWLLGVAGLGALVLLRHRRLRRELRNGVRPPPEIETFVERERLRLGVARPVAVRVCGSRVASAPAVAGVLDPVLVLPAGTADSWDEAAFGPLVVHELVHVRRHDGWVNLAVTTVQIVYFFHPLVWLATWCFLRERERVCDDEVVAAHDGRSAPYVRALCRFALASSRRTHAPGLSSLAGSRSDLVRRIERLAQPGYRSPRRRVLVHGLGAALVLAGLAASFGAREAGGRGPGGAEAPAGTEGPLRSAPDDLMAAVDAYLAGYRPEDRDTLRLHALRLVESEALLDEVAVRILGAAAREDEWLFAEVLSTWLERLERAPDDVGLLRQSVLFASRRLPDLASDLARRGAALEPTEPYWPRRLGEIALANARSGSGPTDREALAQAVVQFRRAADLGEGVERLQALGHAARAELAFGRRAEARRLARQELAELPTVAGSWYEGDAVHEAHVVLGLAALAGGAVEDAEGHLRQAAQAPASPRLRSFGPDMSLAEALLGLGRTEAVLDYFDACHRFWDLGHERLDRWAAQVQQGEPPDFGPSGGPHR